MEDLKLEVSPPGFSGTIAALLQKHPEVKKPYALAWYLYNKGAKSHYKEMPDKNSKSKRKPKKKS